MQARQGPRSSPRLSRSFAGHGWWATAVHLLSLVLVLIVAAPDLSLATDLVYWGVQTQAETELPVMSSADDPSAAKSNSGLACHVHCSCQQAITGDSIPATPSPDGIQLNQFKSICAFASVWPERLSRPPRT
jgi:hypothetical protein